MNFTTDIKRELIAKGVSGKTTERAALAAFLKTSGVVGVVDGKPAFFIVSETEKVAEFFTALFEAIFGETLAVSRAVVDRKRGRGKLLLEYTGERTEEILEALSLPLGELCDRSDEERLAYIVGAFLGGGSCILPSENGEKGTGYHLEFVFSEEIEAEEFCELLATFELLAKVALRGGGAIAYIKSKETISDFLSVVGAQKSLEKFSLFVEKRDEANRSNRAANCFSGNADKTAQASVRQVLSIRKLQKSEGWKNVDPSLKVTAKLRLDNPTMSLSELSERSGLSKSCLNHRIRKLLRLAEEEKD